MTSLTARPRPATWVSSPEPPGRGHDEQVFGDRAPRALVEGLMVAVAAWVYTAVLYQLWNANLRVPLYQERSDARLIANLVQNIETRGWFQSNPHLGAPFGQQLYDFPHGGETFQLVAIKGLSLLTDDYGLIMNLYFLGGAGVTAMVTFLVLRHLRFTGAVAALIALVYTFLPFHFFHEQSHMFRSSYFYAPLACLVLVWSMAWRERFLIQPDPGPHSNWLAGLTWNLRHNLRRKRVIAAVAICVLIAGTETMTTSFTITLLAIGGLIGAVRRRDPAQLLVSAGLAIVLAATFLVLLYPTLNFVHTYGSNDRTARRQVIEQELYGLKISSMVLPSVDHQNGALRRIGNKAKEDSRIVSEGGQALTILGVVGFLAALYRLVTRGWGGPVGGRRRRRSAGHDRASLLDDGALLVLAGTLVATISGFALVLSVAGFSQVRVWNRMVLIIAFFSLLFTGHGFERIGRWVSGRVTRPLPVLGALVVVVAAFGIWDGGRPARRDYPAMAADFESDRTFVSQIEDTVPDGTNVFQLPVVPFPENPAPGRMRDYDQLRPFLQSDGSTNWSYGSVKGRPNGDWQWRRVRDQIGPIGALPGLLGMGFNGLWVDTAGYTDRAADLQAQLAEVLRVEPMVSPNRRQLYYDLRPYRKRLGRSEADLRSTAQRAFGVVPPEPGG